MTVQSLPSAAALCVVRLPAARPAALGARSCRRRRRARMSSTCKTRAASSAPSGAGGDRAGQYNATMAKRMEWGARPFEYDFGARVRAPRSGSHAGGQRHDGAPAALSFLCCDCQDKPLTVLLLKHSGGPVGTVARRSRSILSRDSRRRRPTAVRDATDVGGRRCVLEGGGGRQLHHIGAHASLHAVDGSECIQRWPRLHAPRRRCRGRAPDSTRACSCNRRKIRRIGASTRASFMLR